MLMLYKLLAACLPLVPLAPLEELKVLDTYSANDANGSPGQLLLLRSELDFLRVWTEIHGTNSRINGLTYSAEPPPKLNFEKVMALYLPVAPNSPAGEYRARVVKDTVQLTFKPYPSGSIELASAGGSYTFVVLSKFSSEFSVKILRDAKWVEVARFPKVDPKKD